MSRRSEEPYWQEPKLKGSLLLSTSLPGTNTHHASPISLVNKVRYIALMFLIITAVLIILFETGILPSGICSGNTQVEFLAQTIMIILTLGVIPVALRMSVNMNHHSTQDDTDESNKKRENINRKHLIRVLLISIPMLLTTICYYIYIKVSFAYLGVILLIAFLFVIPKKQANGQGGSRQ